ncbi:recombinase family protein [Mesobacillus jeotgali]|uniref:recombinase family protein n=1 Tax=Mesobacillus jeotgali TaxID=129985 RepID=UPI0009A65CA1|nr:recombinase family protein [Mesobacillus jeotgali]
MLTVKKKVVVYARVSSDQQSLDMQLEAAKPYRKKYHPDEILILSDDGVSAMKNKIEERPALQELLNLIRNDLVDTIIVYQRDRLAREFYEYLEIILLIYTHKVKVIFTATGHLPFNHDIESGIHSEGLFGMMSQIEGMSITNRTRDAFEKAPHSIFGYIVEKSGSKKTYTINQKYKDVIQNLYNDCLSAKNGREFIELLLKYKKLIGRKDSDVFNILVRPFYAGYVRVRGEYERLDYVPPIVSLGIFKDVHEHLQKLVPNLNLNTLRGSDMPLFTPKCHICQQPLSKSNTLDNNLKCKKHKKIVISIEDLNSLIMDVVNDAFKRTNLDQLEKKALALLLKSHANLKVEKENLQARFEQLQLELFTEVNFAKDEKKVNDYLDSLNTLQNEYHGLAEKEAIIKKRISEAKFLVQLIAEKLELEVSQYQDLLIRTFIKEVVVHNGYVDFEIYYSEFYDHKTG